MRADTNRRRRRLSGGHKARLKYSQKNEEKQRLARKGRGKHYWKRPRYFKYRLEKQKRTTANTEDTQLKNPFVTEIPQSKQNEDY